MISKSHQLSARQVLADAITVLCQKILPFDAQLSVDGLLGITVDNREVLLVSIHKNILKEEATEKRQTGSDPQTRDLGKFTKSVRSKVGCVLGKTVFSPEQGLSSPKDEWGDRDRTCQSADDTLCQWSPPAGVASNRCKADSGAAVEETENVPISSQASLAETTSSQSLADSKQETLFEAYKQRMPHEFHKGDEYHNISGSIMSDPGYRRKTTVEDCHDPHEAAARGQRYSLPDQLLLDRDHPGSSERLIDCRPDGHPSNNSPVDNSPTSVSPLVGSPDGNEVTQRSILDSDEKALHYSYKHCHQSANAVDVKNTDIDSMSQVTDPRFRYNIPFTELHCNKTPPENSPPMVCPDIKSDPSTIEETHYQYRIGRKLERSRSEDVMKTASDMEAKSQLETQNTRFRYTIVPREEPDIDSVHVNSNRDKSPPPPLPPAPPHTLYSYNPYVNSQENVGNHNDDSWPDMSDDERSPEPDLRENGRRLMRMASSPLPVTGRYCVSPDCNRRYSSDQMKVNGTNEEVMMPVPENMIKKEGGVNGDNGGEDREKHIDRSENTDEEEDSEVFITAEEPQHHHPHQLHNRHDNMPADEQMPGEPYPMVTRTSYAIGAKLQGSLKRKAYMVPMHVVKNQRTDDPSDDDDDAQRSPEEVGHFKVNGDDDSQEDEMSDVIEVRKDSMMHPHDSGVDGGDEPHDGRSQQSKSRTNSQTSPPPPPLSKPSLSLLPTAHMSAVSMANGGLLSPSQNHGLPHPPFFSTALQTLSAMTADGFRSNIPMMPSNISEPSMLNPQMSPIFTQVSPHLRFPLGPPPLEISASDNRDGCDSRRSSTDGFPQQLSPLDMGRMTHQCNRCGKCMASQQGLLIHYRTHTGEKPHICGFCGKGLSTSQGLQVHVRTHTGEKPFMCIFCGKGFNDKSNMKRHIKQCNTFGAQRSMNEFPLQGVPQ